ncbi:MAG: hypothetical protein NC489_24780 [Ruminococcus flavefaciens]|nr:hypothetical protein [Ruminococcus flavefaciens]
MGKKNLFSETEAYERGRAKLGKAKGEGFVLYMNNEEGERFFFGLNDMGQIKKCDWRLVTESGTDNYNKKNITFFVKDENNFGIRMGEKCFCCGFRCKQCSVVSFLFYIETEQVTFFFYFDSQKDVLPMIFYSKAKKQLQLPLALESLFGTHETCDTVGNIYHAFCKKQKEVSENEERP